MDLPDIRHHLAQFLDKSQLASAASVCKSWNASFAPFLFSKIELSEDEWAPDYSALETHGKYVRTLFISESQRIYPYELCGNLHTLRAEFRIFGSDDYDDLAIIIRKNPGLTNVTVRLNSGEPSYGFMSAVHSCQKLRVLNLMFIKLPDKRSMSLLLDTAVRLEQLIIYGGDTTDPHSLDRWPEFPEMQVLDLNLDESLSQNHQLEIIQSCPRLTAFSFEDSLFSHEAFQSLARHFPQLTSVNLQWCLQVTSAISHKILTSCPELIEFRADFLDARDILGLRAEDDDTAVEERKCNSKDWIYLKLRILDIYICGLQGKPIEWHRQVFRQLSRLKELRTLEIFPRNFNRGNSQDGIDLRIEAGLDMLSSLKYLEVLCFAGIRQQMDEMDVRWMVEAWPRLRRIEGSLHHLPERRNKLKMILWTLRGGSIEVYDGDSEEEEEEEEEDEEEDWSEGDDEYEVWTAELDEFEDEEGDMDEDDNDDNENVEGDEEEEEGDEEDEKDDRG
ncbi:hypothetical protein BC939DRAFT_472774 [Gamsiella multidivaricata]|uniref:uncharacterized protein n=1 Tax=Gamsiella multidivaricata TaxID=101098 RepID=UPI00221FA712|nr:uncharacterized protein BC939DRAFT_472774 [Gamsiella multidivaricata]KAI7831656.1 hypothetical protein BC939DRAFT_472774 [Gamsiella multidivaricata]